MASIRASKKGLERFEQARNKKGWNQNAAALLTESGVSRSTVQRLKRGLAIRQENFVALFKAVGIENWEEMIDNNLLPQTKAISESSQDDSLWVGGEESKVANSTTYVDRERKFDAGGDASEDNPDVLVQRVRSHPSHNAKIQDLCGQLRILDVERPVEIDSIYIDIDVLEKLPSNSRKTIRDFQSFNSAKDKFDRPDLGRTQQERVSGIDVAANNMKLMVLGEPGSGKTTFLKCLAIQCQQGRFHSQLIPIFIELKYFATTARRDRGNFSLLNYIIDDFWLSCDVWEEQINTLLLNGKAFILLDGLDEVEPENTDAVLKEISYFLKLYFNNNFVISCRIGSQLAERLFGLNFTYVKIADFETKQIEAFAKKWFVAVSRNSKEQGLSQAAEFIEKLYLSEHQSILELARTPILLNLACLVFQEKNNFSSSRSKLYEEGLEILLFRWDEVKNIKRDAVYRKLPVWNKKQLLSQVAATAFEKDDYYYIFEKNYILKLIKDSINNLTDEKNVPMQVQLDNESVLKSFAEQHGLLVERARGIYSFSHLTFQEYFTAWKFANSLEPEILEQLVIHFTKARWREVFLLTTEMLPSPDELMLLIKKEVDKIIAKNQKLKHFFTWLNEKSLSVKNQDKVALKLATIRSFYFASELNRFSNKIRELEPRIFECAYALELTTYFGSNNALDIDSLIYSFFVYSGRPLIISCCTLFDTWLNTFNNWLYRLKIETIMYRNIGHNWEFSEECKSQLWQYYDANKFLVDCLNSSRNISPKIRAHIEETFLLPIAIAPYGC